MGSILVRKRKDGSKAYTANIRIKKAGVIVHREAETFDREQAAKAWIKRREAELALPGALDKPDDPTLAEVIDRYNEENQKAHGRTKTQVLRSIKAMPIGSMRCSQIGSPELIAFAQGIDASPTTVMNYVSHLGALFVLAKPAWGYPLDVKAIEDARVVMKRMGLTSKSRERDRRPTLDELDRILKHFELQAQKKPDVIPMTKLVVFAIFSTRRQEEICRITHEDIDEEHMEILVRDMKNPGEKIGNNVRTTLTPEALRIIKTSKTKTGIIWPYNHKSVSAAFTRACQALDIKNLHFHDLRHEGISRLCEMGFTIPQVASVSGHRTWQSLKRYSHIRQSGDKYKNWSWLEKLTQ